MTVRFPLFAVLAACLLLPVSYLAAEEDANDGVAAKQRDLGSRIGKLEQTMERIASLLAKQNPEQAAKLRLAWQRSRSDQNVRVIREIENLIREGYFTEALEKQKDLGESLQRILDILLDRDAEREAVKERIKELESVQKMIEDLIKSETDQALDSEKFADPERALQRAAAAKSKLKDLISRQKKLLDRTKNPEVDPKLADLRKRIKELRKSQSELDAKRAPADQEKLAAKTAELAKDIAKFAKSMPAEMKSAKEGARSRANPADQAGGAAQRAADAMKDAAARMQGSQPFDGSQGDAKQELREAEEALKRLEKRRKDYDKDRLAKAQKRIRSDAERLTDDLKRLERGAKGKDAGSADVGKSQGDMEKAEGSLSKGDRQSAAPDEQQAKEELEKAYKKLEQFEKDLKKLLKLPDYDKMADKQEATEKKAAEAVKKMEQAGKAAGGQKGEPTPGQGQVEGAKGAMQRAKRNLRGKSAKRANSDQKEAVDRLKQAQEQLEEALRQLREEEQLMLLDAIERRLAKMLRDQMTIRTNTIALNLRVKDAKKANRKPARADVDRARQLAEGESGIAAEAEKLLDMMREEGSTVVIPDVIADMQRDLDLLAVRIKKLLAGNYTQEIQTDIIQTLKELIEVIKEERERKQGGGGGGAGDGQEGDQDESLLPNSAELKMLRSLQSRVNRRTTRYEKLRNKEDDERSRLAGKQNGVADLTRTMADKLNRAEDE